MAVGSVETSPVSSDQCGSASFPVATLTYKQIDHMQQVKLSDLSGHLCAFTRTS